MGSARLRLLQMSTSTTLPARLTASQVPIWASSLNVPSSLPSSSQSPPTLSARKNVKPLVKILPWTRMSRIRSRSSPKLTSKRPCKLLDDLSAMWRSDDTKPLLKLPSAGESADAANGNGFGEAGNDDSLYD